MSYRILCLSRNYPNPVIERLGLWTERLVRSCGDQCDFTVVSPVPYSPPLPGLPQYSRFRQIPRHEVRNGIDVYHPRFLTGPGYWLHNYESSTYYWAVRPLADRLHYANPFDLIHAHFVYPDGCAAANLARRYHIPLVITEHAEWRPWLEIYPRVRQRAVNAAAASAFVVAVSQSLRRSIIHFTGQAAKVVVIPNAIDDAIFTLPPDGTPRSDDRLLFVGIMRHVKGLDVLLKALRLLLDRGQRLRLAVVGESFYENYRRDQQVLRELIRDLDIGAQVEFLGGKTPEQVAAEIRASTVLVLPSRRETFGTVLVEALACGVPVIATRCGGPEDVVTEAVGILVEPDDPEALATGITRVLQRRPGYDPRALRRHALETFGMAAVGRQLLELYGWAVLPDSA